MEAAEFQRKVEDLKERRHRIEIQVAKAQERRDRAKKSIVEIDKRCRDEFGVSLKEVPKFIEEKKAEMEQVLEEYEKGLTEIEERMKEIEG